MKTHKDLEIWKLGIELVIEIYEITKNFPKDELYGLSAQIKRSAISYPSNIAEGAARQSKKEYIQFAYISLSSLSELETQLIIASKIGLIKNLEIIDKIEILRRKTLNFIKYLKSIKK
jgi:four helix bundle protein